MAVALSILRTVPWRKKKNYSFFDLKDGTGTSELTLKERDSGKTSGGTLK